MIPTSNIHPSPHTLGTFFGFGFEFVMFGQIIKAKRALKLFKLQACWLLLSLKLSEAHNFGTTCPLRS